MKPMTFSAVPNAFVYRQSIDPFDRNTWYVYAISDATTFVIAKESSEEDAKRRTLVAQHECVNAMLKAYDDSLMIDLNAFETSLKNYLTSYPERRDNIAYKNLAEFILSKKTIDITSLTPFKGNLPKSYRELSLELTRPYLAISDDTHDAILAMSDSNYYMTRNGLLITFGSGTCVGSQHQHALLPINVCGLDRLTKS